MGLKPHDKARLRRHVMLCFRDAIESTTDNGEGLLKEAYDACGDIEEQQFVDAIAREALNALNAVAESLGDAS